MDANPDLFQVLVEYLNDKEDHISWQYPINPCVGNDYFNFLWKLLLEFGLEYDGLGNATESAILPNVYKVKDGNDVQHIISQDNFQSTKLNQFSMIKIS